MTQNTNNRKINARNETIEHKKNCLKPTNVITNNNGFTTLSNHKFRLTVLSRL